MDTPIHDYKSRTVKAMYSMMDTPKAPLAPRSLNLAQTPAGKSSLPPPPPVESSDMAATIAALQQQMLAQQAELAVLRAAVERQRSEKVLVATHGSARFATTKLQAIARGMLARSCLLRARSAAITAARARAVIAHAAPTSRYARLWRTTRREAVARTALQSRGTKALGRARGLQKSDGRRARRHRRARGLQKNDGRRARRASPGSRSAEKRWGRARKASPSSKSAEKRWRRREKSVAELGLRSVGGRARRECEGNRAPCSTSRRGSARGNGPAALAYRGNTHPPHIAAKNGDVAFVRAGPAAYRR